MSFLCSQSHFFSTFEIAPQQLPKLFVFVVNLFSNQVSTAFFGVLLLLKSNKSTLRFIKRSQLSVQPAFTIIL